MKKILFILFIFCSSILQAQNPDIKRTYYWFFGSNGYYETERGGGLDFLSGTPAPLTNNPMHAPEGCASISDTCGNLLFFTDGDTVWNRNLQIMPNGTGLMGCASSTQSALIIPQPGNDSIYYIFTTDCSEDLGARGLRYSAVNMSLAGGLGDIVQKNILLYTPATEKLAATYHTNGTDIWILSCNRPSSDTLEQYYAYLLTTTGINPIPVISPSSVNYKVEDAYMRFSHQGNKVANSWHGAVGYLRDTLEILDFDKSTGILSNPFTLVPDTAVTGYGIAFSPDDSKLYHTIGNWFNYPEVYYKVFQYDLSSNNPVIIAASKITIQVSDSTTPLVPSYWALQNGPDGKIYVAKMNCSGSNQYPDTIDVITNPNATGTACNYIANGVYIGGSSHIGLPNFVDSYFLGSWQPPCDDGIEENNQKYQILIYPNPFSEYTTIDIRNDKLNTEDKLNFTLYDVFGREVQSFINLPIQSFAIYKGNLHSGIYLLKIQIGNYNYIHKLIIN